MVKTNFKNYGERILAEGITESNNTFETGLNNNDLIVGPSGAGKTMGYVIPNILYTNDSFIVVDTKSSLYRRTADNLRKRGYRVLLIDFKNPENSTIGYNPFDFVKLNTDGEPSEMDIIKISKIINPKEDHRDDAFWAYAAADYGECIMAYMLMFLNRNEHNMATLYRLASIIGTPEWSRIVDDLKINYPGCLPELRARHIEQTAPAEKMHSSIVSILQTNIKLICAKELNAIYNNDNRISFKTLGEEKTALFVNVSDSDRSLDSLLNLFYTQAFQELLNSADEDYADGRLKVPVRLFLDDFASNFVIPNFDGISSIIRSRDIYVSVIIQSISQLNSMYGPEKASTIIDNCDVQLYLGGQNLSTAEYYSKKANKPLDKIFEMPLGKVYLFIRSKKPQLADLYDFTRLPLPENEQGKVEAEGGKRKKVKGNVSYE